GYSLEGYLTRVTSGGAVVSERKVDSAGRTWKTTDTWIDPQGKANPSITYNLYGADVSVRSHHLALRSPSHQTPGFDWWESGDGAVM
ncbi:hypothetical protein, partial [Parachitinimonas caeni]